MTIRNTKAAMTRRGLLQASAGMAGILATGRAPAFAPDRLRKRWCLPTSLAHPTPPARNSNGWPRSSMREARARSTCSSSGVR